MSRILAEYNVRLQEREISLEGKANLQPKIDLPNLKFSLSGEVKPHYGLTCIAWVNEQNQLYRELCQAQNAIQTALARAGLAHYFAFLTPASFHMTICDITANTNPLIPSEIETVRLQIENAFREVRGMKSVVAQVHGLGLSTTITTLVRFQSEAELIKVLILERRIKQATQVNVRDFLGHITLAYRLGPLETESESVRTILIHYHNLNFGNFVFSEFDLTYFTDMNTFLPLNTINFETGQLQKHPFNINDTKMAKENNP